MGNIFDDLDGNLDPTGSISSEDKNAIIKRDKPTGEKSKIDLNAKSLKDILGLADRMNRGDLSQYCIDSLPIEHSLVQNAVDASPVIKNYITKGDEIIKTYDKLSDDMFLSLYKPYPELLGKEEVQNNYRLNHGIINDLTDDAQYNKLRDYCQLDDFASAIASISLHEDAIKRLEEIKEEYKDQESIIDAINEAITSQQDLNNLLQNAKSLQQLQNQIIQATGKPNDKLSALESKMKMDLAAAMKLADARAKTFQKVCSNNPDQMRKVNNCLSSGVDSAINRVSEAQDLVEAWGFNPGPEVRVSIDGTIRAIEMIRKSKKLKKFSDIIGALKEMARKEQKIKSKNGYSNITNVTTGNNLMYVLPSEKMLLNNDITKKDFYKRYLDNTLLQYELDHIERKGRGPLIVCVDISGSMEGPKEVWAKAFAISLLEIAQMQRRNYCFISFENKIVDVVIQEKGYLDPVKIVEICEKSTRGGTDFEKPLNEAIKKLNDSRFKGGDIVFITDGDCGISTDFLKKYKETKALKEFTCRGILVNIDGSTCKSTLEKFCDDVILLSSITDLTSDSVQAKEIFRNL